jgi:hypothetical protein
MRRLSGPYDVVFRCTDVAELYVLVHGDYGPISTFLTR